MTAPKPPHTTTPVYRIANRPTLEQRRAQWLSDREANGKMMALEWEMARLKRRMRGRVGQGWLAMSTLGWR